MGTPVTLPRPLPDKWFLVGSANVTAEATHSTLKTRYEKQYVSGYEEGPFGYLCLKLLGGYIAVTTSDFGSGAQYSVDEPKCLKCTTASVADDAFTSGTGLQLGLTKAQASALLKTTIPADLTDVTFETTEPYGSGKVLHTQQLSLEFKADRLIRFSVYDYQEGA